MEVKITKGEHAEVTKKLEELESLLNDIAHCSSVWEACDGKYLKIRMNSDIWEKVNKYRRQNEYNSSSQSVG